MKPAKFRVTYTAVVTLLVACGGAQTPADANPNPNSNTGPVGNLSNPVQMTLNSQRSGNLISADGYWFLVNVNQTGQLDFQTLGNLDTYCGLYDRAGGLLTVDYDSGAAGNCWVKKIVAPGVYYFAVVGTTEADRGAFTANLNFFVEGGGQPGGGGGTGGVVNPPSNGGGSNNGGMASRYIDNRDGTVTDTTTGLQWMRCSVGQRWDGRTCTGEPSELDWYDTMRLARGLQFAGKENWRVPSRLELSSIMYCSSGMPSYWDPQSANGTSCRGDYERPTVDQKAFPGIERFYYWTSDDWHIDSSQAVFVDFTSGVAGTFYGRTKTIELQSILVRTLGR